jgi:F-type H+-transporting ATPase subunit b
MGILLAAANEDASGIDLLFPAWAELIWGSLAFLVLFLVMRKLVFPRMDTMLAERRAAIEGKMEQAERQRVEMEEAKRRFEASLGDAKGEASRIIDEARTAAEGQRREIVSNAEAEAKRIVERATADAEAERARLLDELRGQVGALAVDLAGRIVARELDAATHQGLVDDYIARLAARN